MAVKFFQILLEPGGAEVYKVGMIGVKQSNVRTGSPGFRPLLSDHRKSGGFYFSYPFTAGVSLHARPGCSSAPLHRRAAPITYPPAARPRHCASGRTIECPAGVHRSLAGPRLCARVVTVRELKGPGLGGVDSSGALRFESHSAGSCVPARRLYPLAGGRCFRARMDGQVDDIDNPARGIDSCGAQCRHCGKMATRRRAPAGRAPAGTIASPPAGAFARVGYCPRRYAPGDGFVGSTPATRVFTAKRLVSGPSSSYDQRRHEKRVNARSQHDRFSTANFYQSSHCSTPNNERLGQGPSFPVNCLAHSST